MGFNVIDSSTASRPWQVVDFTRRETLAPATPPGAAISPGASSRPATPDAPARQIPSPRPAPQQAAPTADPARSSAMSPAKTSGVPPDVQAAADRTLNSGVRWLIKDDYEQRMDVLAHEMSEGDAMFRQQLAAEILKRDPGAFGSWLRADRLDSRVAAGTVTGPGRAAVLDGLRAGLGSGALDGSQVPTDFVRDSHDSGLIQASMRSQKLDDRAGFGRALQAFSGLQPQDLQAFVADPGNGPLLHDFSLSVQRHQDWYEQQTVDLVAAAGGQPVTQEAPVQFSVDQLHAMRSAFKANDGLLTHGELLLAYPDRLERNEQVTQQYHEFSQGMAAILGDDQANWPTYAQWASDEIGRNLQGNVGIAMGEAGLGNPRYWLSLGNTKLGSDIGPAFQQFVETYQDPAHRGQSFESFWSGLEQKWGGRGISYLDGNQDPQHDMRNAFKAYHEAMQLRAREAAATDPAQRQALADRRSQLMLYGNVLVGLQEQKLIQSEVENGLKILPMFFNGGIVNPRGRGGAGINVHLPGTRDPAQARNINTDRDVPATPFGASLDPGTEFTMADGRTIRLQEAMRQRLAGLPGAGPGDPLDRAHSDAAHWESYGDRMTYIYHLFANYQGDRSLQVDPRAAFGTRAVVDNNDPWARLG